MKHSIMPMKQSCCVKRRKPGQHPGGEGGVGERLIDAKEWSSGAERGGTSREGTYAGGSSTAETACLVLVFVLLARRGGWIQSI